MALVETDPSSNIRLLDRFYGMFAIVVIGMLTIGVPFVFIRKTGSAVACVIALVIFEVRKVELTNYLPALAVAPLLVWLFGR